MLTGCEPRQPCSRSPAPVRSQRELVKRFRPAPAAVELALGAAGNRQRLVAVVMTFVTIFALRRGRNHRSFTSKEVGT